MNRLYIYSVSLICVVFMCSLSSLASQYQVYHMKTSSYKGRTIPSPLTERIAVKWPRYYRYDVTHQSINQSINLSINQFNQFNQFNQSIQLIQLIQSINQSTNQSNEFNQSIN